MKLSLRGSHYSSKDAVVVITGDIGTSKGFGKFGWVG